MIGLDIKGVIAALILAIIILYTTNNIQYLIGLGLFLVLGNYVSLVNPILKIKNKSLERVRSIKNVLSNGIIPVIFAVLNNPIGYLGSLAAITADKFSSELGIFDKQVYTILSFKRTIPGRSGGVSLYGTVAGLFGSIIIAIFGVLAFNIPISSSLAIFLGGALGNLADSIAGYFEEMGIGTKETSNIIGALIGGLTAIFIYNI